MLIAPKRLELDTIFIKQKFFKIEFCYKNSPNPNIAHLKLLESELKFFISDGNPNVVDETTRKMAVKYGGFGVPNINTFWKAIRMSWLRRSIASESTWFKLHCHEVSPDAFDPVKSNFESLSKAKGKCMNPFWKEVYSSLLDYRMNVLLNHPQEYRYVPINGEPHITSNKISIRQEWAQHLNLNNILDCSGNIRELGAVRCNRKPYDYEFCFPKWVVKDFLDIYSGGRLGANNDRVTSNDPENGEYNVYGRFVTKRKKGCSYYYSLLNTHSRMDSWVNCCTKLESEAESEGLSWECDEYEILIRVKQVYKTPYLNRLKQFFLRLLRNNLYFGKKKL